MFMPLKGVGRPLQRAFDTKRNREAFPLVSVHVQPHESHVLVQFSLGAALIGCAHPAQRCLCLLEAAGHATVQVRAGRRLARPLQP